MITSTGSLNFLAAVARTQLSHRQGSVGGLIYRVYCGAVQRVLAHAGAEANLEFGAIFSREGVGLQLGQDLVHLLLGALFVGQKHARHELFTAPPGDDVFWT
jgi:hypothetical protein